MPSQASSSAGAWELPPLILHPFNERVPPSVLLDNSRAALMLSGLIPGDGSSPEDLRRRLLSGRYSEIRMLFFLGKDVFRWLDQCLESAARNDSPDPLCRQTFASLLVASTPQPVKEKLIHWGVSDYSSLFARAIGLNVVWTEPPAFDCLSQEFLTNYHKYADALYQAFMRAEPYGMAPARNFHFELYASGEYSRMLESEWESE